MPVFLSNPLEAKENKVLLPTHFGKNQQRSVLPDKTIDDDEDVLEKILSTTRRLPNTALISTKARGKIQSAL